MAGEHPSACIHVRAALIATNALLVDRHGLEHRGDLRWCTECGALLPLITGVQTRWLRPGDRDVMRAVDELREREADAADGEVTLMLDPEREAVSAHAAGDGALERERAAREADAIAQNPDRTPSEQAVARVIAKRIRGGGV